MKELRKKEFEFQTFEDTVKQAESEHYKLQTRERNFIELIEHIQSNYDMMVADINFQGFTHRESSYPYGAKYERNSQFKN